MAKPQVDEKRLQEEREKESFKGTFISVLLLGGFIALSWLGVWIIYLIR